MTRSSGARRASGETRGRAGEGDSKLATLIEDRCEELVQRFVGRAREAGAAEALPREEVIDSLRSYLRELAGRVRAEWATGIPAPVDASTIATTHGEQRFTHGYDIAAIVREYGALHDLLCELIVEDGTIELTEARVLSRHLVYGIADAASKYATLRDEELRKRTAEHIAFLAHELRNPLSSARMAASLIGAADEQRAARARAALDRGLTRAATLLDDALVDVRLRELGDLDYTKLDVGRLLREVAEESEVDAAAKGIVLSVEGDGEIDGDRKALRSAVSNLVRNAVKFSHAGGTVRVRVRPLVESRLVIEVEDACGGVAQDTLKKLFDPFVQAGADRSGFGLGLAIAKQAVEAHGGTLRVHSVAGSGCVFVLEVPQYRGA